MSGLFSQPLIIRFIREVGASEHNSVQTHSLAGQRASFLPSLLGHQSCRDWKFLVLKGRMEPSEAHNFRYPPHEILSQSLGALPNWMASRFALLVRFFCYFPIPAGLQILQENPCLLLVFWSFYFPVLLGNRQCRGMRK